MRRKKAADFVLLNRVKSDMFRMLVIHAFVLALNVASHNQVLADPVTVAGWLKIPCTLPALTHIQITMATETGTSSTALMRNSFLHTKRQRTSYLWKYDSLVLQLLNRNHQKRCLHDTVKDV